MIAAEIQIESEEPLTPVRWHAGRHLLTDKARVYLSDVWSTSLSVLSVQSNTQLNLLILQMNGRPSTPATSRGLAKTASYPSSSPAFRTDALMVHLFPGYGVPLGSKLAIAFCCEPQGYVRILFTISRVQADFIFQVQVQTPSPNSNYGILPQGSRELG